MMYLENMPTFRLTHREITMARPLAPDLIDFWSDDYTDAPVIIVTYAGIPGHHGTAHAMSVSQFAKSHERNQYSHDDDPASVLFVDRDGNVHPVVVETKTGRWDEDDYAVVSGKIINADSGVNVAHFSYRIDGRA